MDISAEAFKSNGETLASILGLETSPVGVRFVFGSESLPEGVTRLHHHRYCQALMKARRGQRVSLDAEGIACPAAAAAFGFRPLPEGLRSGQGLVGFGIVADPQVGQRMFEGMRRLESGVLQRLELFPLERTVKCPDLIVIEGSVEQLMWVNLAYLNVQRGERLIGSTAILQATCVDSTILPFLEHRLNFGFGCYGCREATDLMPQETVIGFPGDQLEAVVKALGFLAEKAIPNSRAKRVYQSMQKTESGV